MFENVSEGRDEIEDCLLYWVLRLGDRREEVVDRCPDEGDDEIHGVDLDRVWAGETKPSGGLHSDCSDDWLRHGVVGEEERGGRGPVSVFIYSSVGTAK